RVGLVPLSPDPNVLLGRLVLWSSTLVLILLLSGLLTAARHFSAHPDQAWEMLLRLAPLILLIASQFVSGTLSLILIGAAAASAVLVVLYWFSGGYRARVPAGEIAIIAAIAVAVFFLFIFLEERSRLVENVSSEVRPTP
ncbi:MAG: hypothetical protein CUN49_17030, partial [Candidatus Thermofonsia Clade 1 bacterium]